MFTAKIIKGKTIVTYNGVAMEFDSISDALFVLSAIRKGEQRSWKK